MKNIIHFLLISFLSIAIISCGGEASAPTIDKNPKPSDRVTTAQFMKKLDEASMKIEPKEFAMNIEEGYACDVKDFGQKKYIFCFAGGLKSNEVQAYYDKDGVIQSAIFSTAYYNASPANLEEYDESKTTLKQVTLYFKEGSFYNYDKILDLKNNATEMTDEQIKDWKNITAAIPPL